MTYYRLLRDNKETGPYSEEEMIAKGFKPYDLLWAEGKSAGWQYPSEIMVFKNHAPIVEEQPYERFFKKQPPQKLFSEETFSNTGYPSQVAKPKEIPQQALPAAIVPKANVPNVPARHIHVTLPSGNTVNLTTLVTKKEVRESAESPARPVSPEKSTAKDPVAPNEKSAASFAKTVVTTAPPLTASNQVVTENIGNRQHTNVDKSLAYPSGAAGFSWTLVGAAVLGIATMVGLGIMIGLSINREKNDAVFNESLRRKTISSPVVKAHAEQPVSAVTPAPVVSTTAQAQPPVVTATPSINKVLALKTPLKAATATDKAVKEEKKSAVEDRSVVQDHQVLQTQDETVQHAKPVTVVSTASIEKNLHVSENDFKSGAFGGISNLKYTLFNDSRLTLQSVEIEVDYLLANKKIFKTEKLLFKDVAPGAKVTLDAPASSRGIKVSSRIVKINAKDAVLPDITAKS